jgi:uncharacterized protein
VGIHVCHIIRNSSYSKGSANSCLEGKIVQDADLIESCGAIGIMRNMFYCSELNAQLYNWIDHKIDGRASEERKYALDFQQGRAMNLMDRITTPTAKAIYEKRRAFVTMFLAQFDMEIMETMGHENPYIQELVSK